MSADVGLIVLGSQQERHGRLPEDTDTKLAVHIAFEAALVTGAKLVGIVNSAAEKDYIKHGIHHSQAAVLGDIEHIINHAVERIGIRSFIIVNGHGGNKLIAEHVPELERTLNVKLRFDSSIVDVEGAHAGSGECSMAVAARITSLEELTGQGDFERYPEVGFVGLKEAQRNETIKGLAEETRKKGILIDEYQGKKLLNEVVKRTIVVIEELGTK